MQSCKKKIILYPLHIKFVWEFQKCKPNIDIPPLILIRIKFKEHYNLSILCKSSENIQSITLKKNVIKRTIIVTENALPEVHGQLNKHKDILVKKKIQSHLRTCQNNKNKWKYPPCVHCNSICFEEKILKAGCSNEKKKA